MPLEVARLKAERYSCTECDHEHLIISRIGRAHIQYCSPSTPMSGEVGKAYIAYKESLSGAESSMVTPESVGETPAGAGVSDTSAKTMEAPADTPGGTGVPTEQSSAPQGEARASTTEAASPEEEWAKWLADMKENFDRLFKNDANLEQRIDELAEKLGTTREPSSTPEWANKAGDQVQAKMPDIIDTVLGVLKGLVNPPTADDMFNFDPEFREYVQETLKTTLEARKKIVLRAVKDIEDGKLYYREAGEA